jgi:acetyl esterase/lipase
MLRRIVSGGGLVRALWRGASVLAVGLSASSISPAGADTEAVVIEPATDLVDGQLVRVTGTGFVPESTVSLVQCVTSPVDGDDCDGSTERFHGVDADSSFTASFTLAAVIDTARTDSVDCRTAGSCVLVASRGLQPLAEVTHVPLAFDADAGLLPPPVAAVAPSHDLVDGQVVTVDGDGFRPQGPVQVLQCAPGAAAFDSCRQGTSRFLIADEQGGFSTPLTLFAVVSTPAGGIDCRTTAQPCLVIATQGGFSAPPAARVDVQFAPDAPLLPPPGVEVTPATDIEDGSIVTVRGNGFSPDVGVEVRLCEAADAERRCDDEGALYPIADASGTFEVSVFVVAVFETFEREAVDCRQPPGCEIAVVDLARDRLVRVPVNFGAAPAPRGRYLDPVFDDVETNADVVYREAVDYRGNRVQLHVDIYQPTGDTATRRPVVVWMHGGYFIFGDKGDMADYAQEFARRGYVAVSLQYRLRQGLSTGDAAGIAAAAFDAYDDATAAVGWLRSHADEYRIDPDAIAVGGYSAGAVTALNLAYLPGQRGPAASTVDAAVSIAGLTFGAPEPGEPPSIVFHGTADGTVPFATGEGSCRAAQAAGVHCELVRYAGAGHGIAYEYRRHIVRRTADFLAERMLNERGYLDQPPVTGGVTVTLPRPLGGALDPARPAVPIDAEPSFTG